MTNHQHAVVAQLGERQTEDLKVPGSIPGDGNASMAEWSKALDLSSSIQKNAWVRTPLEASTFGRVV